MLQTALPKRRRQNPDQVIALAVVVNDQGCECLIGQARRVGAGPQGNLADVATRLVENANYCSTAVVAPLENRSGHRHELPEQIEGFRRVGLGDHLDDSAALTLEVTGQGSRACQSTNERDRAMIVSRLRTSLTSSAGLCAPASSTLRRRLAAALPALISISNSANRFRPRASRFFAFWG